MLSLENDVGPYLAACLASGSHSLISIQFKGREGIVWMRDDVEMRRPEELHLRKRRMLGPRDEMPT